MSRLSRPTRRGDVETYVIPDGASLLFDPVTEAGYPLDLVCSLVWDYCDGMLSELEIAHEIAALLPDAADAASCTLAILDDLARQGLLRPTVTLQAPPERDSSQNQ
jgi:hypothetical protein